MEQRPLTSEDTIARLQSIEAEIRRLGVRRLALFGSVLRGDDRPDSDVDLLVQFESGQKSFDRFMAVADLLEATLQRRVDLVTTEALSPHLGPHIIAAARDVISS